MNTPQTRTQPTYRATTLRIVFSDDMSLPEVKQLAHSIVDDLTQQSFDSIKRNAPQTYDEADIQALERRPAALSNVQPDEEGAS